MTMHPQRSYQSRSLHSGECYSEYNMYIILCIYICHWTCNSEEMCCFAKHLVQDGCAQELLKQIIRLSLGYIRVIYYRLVDAIRFRLNGRWLLIEFNQCNRRCYAEVSLASLFPCLAYATGRPGALLGLHEPQRQRIDASEYRHTPQFAKEFPIF